jgi:hypothetical protein
MVHALASSPRAASREAPGSFAVGPVSEGPIRAGGRLVLVLVATALASCVAARPPSGSVSANAAREGGESAANTRNDASAAQVSPAEPAQPAEPAPPKELPRGGRKIFPTYRLVGFCGTPGAPELGALQGNFPKEVKALEAHAAPYGSSRRPLLPVFELIAVVVQSGAGPDGKYRRRVDDSIVDQYLREARKSKALLLLNIQPGQSDFLTEVKTFESYLREPDVGVALDPEWAMKPNQRPGRFYGQTDGETINDVATYLSNIVSEGNLPEKALVFHQVNRGVLKDEVQLKPLPGVVFIKSVDGLGPAHSKVETYDYLMATIRKGIHPGFKLFFDEDTRNGNRIMSPKEVLALWPQPEYVMYE